MNTAILCLFSFALVFSMVHGKSISASLTTADGSVLQTAKITRRSKSVYEFPDNILFKDAIKSKKVPVPPEVRKMAFSRKYKELAKSMARIEMSVNITDREAAGNIEGHSPTHELSTSVRQLSCTGPGLNSGMMLTPAESFFSPPGAPCLSGQEGPPFLCLCRYGCGQFLFVRYCFFVCGFVGELKFGFGPGFTCRIEGVAVPSTPGFGTCPLTPEPLCSA